MTTTEPRVAEVPARPERSVPKPQFTDAEARLRTLRFIADEKVPERDAVFAGRGL